jgi:AcrR family transcriptional regulator
MTRAEREEQILATAEEFFAERGYRQATMDELATRLGVTKPVIYDHFGSKDGLLLALLTRVRDELQDETLRALGEGPHDPRELFYRVGLAFFTFVDAHGCAWSVLNREAALLTGDAGAEVEAMRQQQADLLAHLLADHGLAPGLAEAQGHAQLIVGAAERLALWRQDHHPSLTAQAAADLMQAVLWYGLGAASTESASRPSDTR